MKRRIGTITASGGALVITGITEPEDVNGTYLLGPFTLGVRSFENTGYKIFRNEVYKWAVVTNSGFPAAVMTSMDDVDSPTLVTTWDLVEGVTGLPVIVPETEDPGQLLQLTCGAAIYYTTDGSYPAPANAEATLYTAPFELPAAGTVVRAAGYATGMNPGDCIEILITP